MAPRLPSLPDQLAALDAFSHNLPADLRKLMRERYIMGYQQYGDAWAGGRDNLAEAAPEIADTLVYIFQTLLTGDIQQKDTHYAKGSLSQAWMHLAALRKAAIKCDDKEAPKT